MVKLSGASPLKKTELFPTPPPPEAINILIIILRTLVNNFVPRHCYFLWGAGEVVIEEPSMSFILSYESTVINITTKEASLYIAAQGNTDHGHQPGFLRRMSHGSLSKRLNPEN